MSKFKPTVEYCDADSIHEYKNRRSHTPYKVVVYDTYAKLKKDIKNIIIENNKYSNDEVFVTRSRRGQWGEWFERWDMVNGKVTVIKEGWQ